MPNVRSRAAFLVAMLLLPGAPVRALTCVDDPARAETMAREADAIVLARVVALPADPPVAPALPGDAQAEGGTNAAILSAFLTPPTERVLQIEATEILKGEVPEGVFRAKFREGPCAPLPAEGKRRILYLVHEDGGWRMLGSN